MGDFYRDGDLNLGLWDDKRPPEDHRVTPVGTDDSFGDYPLKKLGII